MKQPQKYAMSSTRGKNLPSNNRSSVNTHFLKFVSAIIFLSLPNYSSAQIRINDLLKSWKYESIYYKPGEPAKKVSALDLMTLRSTNTSNTFSYALPLENIKASGNWELRDSLLIFTYEPAKATPAGTPPIIRNFQIIRLSNDSLLFRERLENGKPGLYFSFSNYSE
jgi:hypothetical protein